MMRLAFILILVLSGYGAESQLYDKSWAIGRFCTKIQFDTDSVRIHGFKKFVGAIRSAASICDANGNFQLVYAGTQIQDSIGDTVANCNHLVDSLYDHYINHVNQWLQQLLVLPKKDGSYYALTYSISDSLFTVGSDYYPDNLYYSVVDMSMNGGKGQVVSKRNLLHHGIMGYGWLTACQHANGRDWWIVTHGYCNNEYRVFLSTPDTIVESSVQSIGPAFCRVHWGGQAVFSPDGSKFAAALDRDTMIVLMDFDRCTGRFSNPDTLIYKSDIRYFPTDPLPYRFTIPPIGLAFNASSRYLYACDELRVKKYDLHATSINGSQMGIFFSDYVHDGVFPRFTNMFLLPTGQIIVTYLNGSYKRATVIDSADMPDTLSRVSLYAFGDTMFDASTCANVPTTMRLGALKGSGCDTIPTSVNDLPQSRIMISPNPAHTTLSVSLRQYERDAVLYIYDALGREMYSNRHFYLDDYVDVRTYPVGVYYLRLCSASGEYGVKFVKD